MEAIKVKDMRNGREIASLFMNRYLNRCAYQTEPFINHMRQQSKAIKDNFTYLVFSWLYELSEVAYYDARNEASVNLAQEVCQHIGTLPELCQLTYEDDAECWVDPDNHEQVAMMMSKYLVAGSEKQYRDFLDYALREHRTLQQSLTRLFKDWIQKCAVDVPLVKEYSVYFYRYALPLV